MTDWLEVADGLRMDASETATQTLAILATKGGGKTYLGGVIGEELHAHHCPVIVLDPVGNWWPIRLGSDGKSAGLPFAVIGGEHADVPLDPGRGADIARFLVEQAGSAVIDLSELSMTKRKGFVADFCEALIKAARRRRSPLMVILEEAQHFVPQRLSHGEERMFGAVTTLVRLGRNFAVGCLLLSQRPQSVNKEALNMVECLFVGQMRGAQDRKAIKEWVSEQDVALRVQLDELPRLSPGDFFCWSPSWLRVFQKCRARAKRTFDGSSTPRIGKTTERRELVPIDVQALTALLAPPPEEVPLETAKKASRRSSPTQSDPTLDLGLHSTRNAELEGRVAQLEHELSAVNEQLEGARTQLEIGVQLSEAVARALHEHPVHRAAGPHREVNARDHRGILAPSLTSKPFTVEDEDEDEDELDGQDRAVLGLGPPKGAARAKAVPSRSKSALNGTSPGPAPSEPSSGGTREYQLSLLETLVTYGTLDRSRLSLLSGKSKSSTTFAGAIRSLVATGHITDQGGQMQATALGRRERPGLPLPKGRALFEHWKSKLSPYDGEAFEALAKARGGLSRSELAERTGHSPSSTTFAASIRRIKAMGLATELPGSRKIVLLDHVRTSMGLA